MPKVSVIIPAYNAQEYLREALDSLKRQTLEDMEFICVNDGSSDDTLRIMREYEAYDKRFVVFDQANGGYGVAMNNGMAHATGEYVGILEADDFVPPEMYQELYQAAEANDLDFVKADFYRFYTIEKNGNVFWEYNHLDKSGEWYNKVINPTETPEVIRLMMNTWCGIYRRSFLEENKITHHETPGASFQDNSFYWKTMMYAQRVMFLDQPFYRNRRDNPNSSVRSREKVYTMNQEYDYIRDFFLLPENREKWQIFKGWFTLKRFGNYEFTLGRIGQEYRKDFVQRISREMHRARDLDELQIELFPEETQVKLKLLISDPDRFFEKYGKAESAWATPEEKAERKVDEVKSSSSYKVGETIMFLPKMIKKLLGD